METWFSKDFKDVAIMLILENEVKDDLIIEGIEEVLDKYSGMKK